MAWTELVGSRSIDDRRRRFRIRALTVAGLGLALGMLAIGVLLLVDMRRDAWDQARRSSSALAMALEREIGHTVEAYDASIQGVMLGLAQPGIDRISPELRRLVLFDHAVVTGELGSLRVLNEHGDVVYDSAPGSVVGSAAGSAGAPPGALSPGSADAEYFTAQARSATLGLYVSRPFADRVSGAMQIGFSRRLNHADGAFAGVVVGTLDLRYFRALFDELDLGPHGSVTLLRADGRVMARMPYVSTDIDRDLGDTPGYRRNYRDPSGWFRKDAAIDGVERLYAFRYVGDLPLIINVGVGAKDVLGAWRRKAWPIGLALAGLCLATMAMTLLVRRELLLRLSAEHLLVKAAQELAALATRDGLTGLSNRRELDRVTDREWGRARRGDTAISLLLLDVDHFKPFNDTYGHQAGDAVLRDIATCITRHVLRPADLCARYGGEEFAVLLPETELDSSVAIGERIRQAVADANRAHDGSPFGRLTVSIGVATARPARDMASGAPDLLNRADQALYAAKRAGRNCVCTTADTHDSADLEAAPDRPATLTAAPLA